VSGELAASSRLGVPIANKHGVISQKSAVFFHVFAAWDAG